MMVPMTSFKRRHPPGIVVNRDPCDLESSRIRPSNNTTSKITDNFVVGNHGSPPLMLRVPVGPLLDAG